MSLGPDAARIGSDLLTVEIAALGAEMQAIDARDGRALLWDGDPAWWSGRAPLLFPIVGALNGDALRLDGRAFRLPRHGFARRRRFERVLAQPDRALFRLTDDAETRAAYPFAFVLEVAYAVSGSRLTVEARLSNPGPAALPAAFGFHPAFRWPLPGQARPAHRVTFDAPEPAPIRRLSAAGLVLPGAQASPVQGAVLEPRDALFADDALIFDRLASRGLTFAAEAGPRIRLDFPAMPYLGVWTKPGAPFLCLEPWHGLADAEAYVGDFRDKPGVVEVAPGATRVFAMAITVENL